MLVPFVCNQISEMFKLKTSFRLLLAFSISHFSIAIAFDELADKNSGVKLNDNRIFAEKNSALGSNPVRFPGRVERLTGYESWRLENKIGQQQKSTRLELPIASDFCKRLLHLNISEIKAIAGEPIFFGFPFMYDLASEDKVLLYGFGHAGQTVWMRLNDSVCTEYGILDKEQESKFAFWKAQKIVSFAKNKPLSEIVKTEGKPTYARNFKNVDVDWNSPDCTYVLYQTGISTAARLSIEDQICQKSIVVAVAH